MVDFQVTVVLPAAGCGTRMGMGVPKQFVEVFGRPLISYTIEAFESISWVDNIIIAGPIEANKRKDLENIVLEFGHNKVMVTTGGSTRHRSIFNGIQYLKKLPKNPDVVVIHDAVRPFIEETLLKEIVVAAWKYGACGVVTPLVSTVLSRNKHGFLDHSLDRSKYVGSEMPQAFKYDIILNAYQQCTEHDFDYGTECLQLALKYNQTRPFLIDGPDYLWKITYKKDIFAFKGIMKVQFRRVVKLKVNHDYPSLNDSVKQKFEANGVEVFVDDSTETPENINILVVFKMSTSLDVNQVNEEIGPDISNIKRNGILLIFCSGTSDDHQCLKKTIRHFAREYEHNNITCCAVFHEQSVSNKQNIGLKSLNEVAEMIVNTALETPSFLSGQVFTIADQPL